MTMMMMMMPELAVGLCIVWLGHVFWTVAADPFAKHLGCAAWLWHRLCYRILRWGWFLPGRGRGRLATLLRGIHHEWAVKSLVSWMTDLRPAGVALSLRRSLGHSHSTKSPRYKASTFSVPMESLGFDMILGMGDDWVDCQSFVTFHELAVFTLRHGKLPLVLPEFRNISVGGALQGLGIESSSWMHGFVHDSVLEVEALIPSEQQPSPSSPQAATHVKRRRIVPAEDPEFWSVFVGSLGTIAWITRVKLRLQDALPRTEIGYYRLNSYDQLAQFMSPDNLRIDSSQPAPNFQFVDAVVLSSNKIMLMVAAMRPRKSAGGSSSDVTLRLSGLRDPIFAEHLEEIFDVPERTSDVVSTMDYLFRYDRGAFFLAPYREDLTWLQRVTSKFFLDSRSLFQLGLRWGSDTAREEQLMVQDLCVPAQNMVSLLRFMQKTYAIFPLWICPVRCCRSGGRAEGSNSSLPTTVFVLQQQDTCGDSGGRSPLHINVGIYGDYSESVQRKFPHVPTRVSILETHVTQLGGVKGLYAHSYYSKADFRRCYPQLGQYEAYRAKHGLAATLMHIYDKAVVLSSATR